MMEIVVLVVMVAVVVILLLSLLHYGGLSKIDEGRAADPRLATATNILL